MRVISDASGVPLSTLAKIKYGRTKNPRYQTVQTLAEYFARVDAAKSRRRSRRRVAAVAAPDQETQEPEACAA